MLTVSQSQDISRNLMKPKIHCRIHYSTLLVAILAHDVTNRFFKAHFNSAIPSMSWSSRAAFFFQDLKRNSSIHSYYRSRVPGTDLLSYYLILSPG